VTWLYAVDLTGLAEYSILQPDSLCCNQSKQKKKLPTTQWSVWVAITGNH